MELQFAFCCAEGCNESANALSAFFLPSTSQFSSLLTSCFISLFLDFLLFTQKQALARPKAGSYWIVLGLTAQA